MRQLTYAFKDDLRWAALEDEKSLLFNIFLQPELRDVDQPDKLSVHKLICLGLMLCEGSP